MQILVRLTIAEVQAYADVMRQVVMGPLYDGGSDGQMRSRIYAILKTALQTVGITYISDARIREPGWYGPRNLDHSGELEVEFPDEMFGIAQILCGNISHMLRERDEETSGFLRSAAEKMRISLSYAGYAYDHGRGWVKSGKKLVS